MRFNWGPFPEAADFEPQHPWRPLDEPTPEELKKRAGPIAAGAAAAFALLWLLVVDVTRIDWHLAIVGGIVWFPGLILVHEAIHALLHPRCGLSGSTIVGYWPQHAFFYAAYLGEMSRGHLVCVLLAPLVVLSCGPLLIAPFTEATSSITVCVSVTNALLSCGDIVGAFYVIRGAPAKAILRNKGWRTYWKTKA